MATFLEEAVLATTNTMTGANKKLTAAVEVYFKELGRIHASGGATGERSSYPALANLLNAVGATLKPKVFCVSELVDWGSGHLDFGLYAAKQVQKGQPRKGQILERGAVEVKLPDEDTQTGTVRDQVTRYWDRYRLALVTNLREFALVGPDPDGGETTFDIYLNDRAYWRNVSAAVWNYKLGGYQVLKKWLSYRERDVLGRALSPEEVQYFAEMVRRVGAVISTQKEEKNGH